MARLYLLHRIAHVQYEQLLARIRKLAVPYEKIEKAKKKISARAITAEEKEFNAFKTLRKARSDKKYHFRFRRAHPDLPAPVSD